jgi:hypothetical protein
VDRAFWDVFPVIIIFPTFAFMFKWYFEYRTRKQLIEKGLVDEKVKYLQFNRWDQYAPGSLKWGLVFLFVGVAIIFLRILSDYIPGEIILGAILVAAGLGLLVYYLIADMAMRRHERSQKEIQGSPGMNP